MRNAIERIRFERRLAAVIFVGLCVGAAALVSLGNAVARGPAPPDTPAVERAAP